MSILIQAVKQIQATDKHWLTEELQGKGIFSVNTVWHYKLEEGVENCKYCIAFDGRDFLGNVLRLNFPDLQVYDENYIWVNYHQTLWEKDTCRCFLYREGALPKFVANPETLFGEE